MRRSYNKLRLFFSNYLQMNSVQKFDNHKNTNEIKQKNSYY